MSTKLNDKQVKSLLRKGKLGRYAAGNGLYLRISNEGTGFWAVRYTVNGKRREISIGTYPDLTLANATIQTAKLKSKAKQGVDPLVERKRAANAKFRTMDDLAADWLKDCRKRLKHPNIPWRVYERDLQPIFGDLPLERITPLDIRDALDRITDSGRPSISNDALMYCKQIFRHGIRLGVINANPADAFTVRHAGGVEKNHDFRRTCRSLLAGAGVPSHIAERCLNHKVRGGEWSGGDLRSLRLFG
ncbi:MAG: integrase arm-type DNA-binding domain-containing protein [Thermodesulfobacteriota bacterium]|nr:integrase arm-type DNA-binding domain-containing protein [Thermodesulfobacteriota bacterium]